MIAIQRILCPTDLTTESDEALRYAVALSSAYNAKLFVLYCKKTRVNNGRSQCGETTPLFIASLAPNLGLKSISELNWEGLVLGVLFGSTTDRVLRQAPCPVLVARQTVINGKSS